MSKTLFFAGASGAIGKRLIPLLLADDWRIVATTRSADKADVLKQLGVEPIVVDVFEELALKNAVVAAQPQYVMHQLTDLPPGLEPARMADASERNARLRDIGTRNLVAAAVAAKVSRFVAQSIAFAYADGPLPHAESDILAVNAEGRPGVSARGVASLEGHVLAAPFDGLVLRFGRLYGPGTGFDAPPQPAPLHVDAAAMAAFLALKNGSSGVYNVAEDDGFLSTEKAKKKLHWDANWRAPVR